MSTTANNEPGAHTKRALISVSDKSGLLPFAQGLAELGFEILSTGGTAAHLRNAGLRVVDVSEYTQSPEVMDGRVKTLHPRVHGGLLMRETEQDAKELASLGGSPIDVVAVNLYPFESTVAKGAPHEEIIENIDIGGPSMVRSAAKNHTRVTVVVDPNDYSLVLKHLQEGTLDSATRRSLAAKAFAQTAAYDVAISNHLTSLDETLSPQTFSKSFGVVSKLAYELRYGENPHQRGALYVSRNAHAGTIAAAQSIGAGAKELSYNNLVDCDAALEAVREFDGPAAVVVKHANPCGVATAATIEEAYIKAREADALSAFGGIVALNRSVSKELAQSLVETFLECVVAPSFEPDALPILHTKKNLRLLSTGVFPSSEEKPLLWKSISGGFVVQERDVTANTELADAKVVTERAPTPSELRALHFAWNVVKHVKSNAIVLTHESSTVGIGAGQMSRVVSVDIACQKAGNLAKGSALASDAFFPFADGLELAAKAGVTAVIQPGGSVKDAEVIAVANKFGIAMIFTGARHFRH